MNESAVSMGELGFSNCGGRSAATATAPPPPVDPRRPQAATVLCEQNAESPLPSLEATMPVGAIGVEAVTIWKYRPR
ncbi:hypothetical protein [Streptomyces sp. NPDC059015]|uniref:hypothetical protein n=1 Tax=Streptomyces sp. NPDC059015 TaxID=3346698 RepID=UPI0036D135F6